MSDFVSSFWGYLIIAISVGGIVGLFFLLRSNNIAGSSEPTGHVWDEDLVELNNPLPRWWLMMFDATLVFSVVYFAVYPALGEYKGYFGWTQVGQYEDEVKEMEASTAPLYAKYMATDIAELAKDEAALKTGGRIFQSYCSVCHGSDAGGAKGFPNLRDGDWLYGGTPADIEASVLHGRQGAMPPWRAAVGEDGAENLAAYILSMGGRKHSDGSAAAGKATYDAMCAGCHGMKGEGNVFLGAPNLSDNIWLYGGSKRAIMASILDGRNGNMPAHADFLGKEKVHVVSAYVYSLSQK